MAHLEFIYTSSRACHIVSPCIFLDNPVERPPGDAQGIDPSLNFRIIFESRRMVRFGPGIDDQRAGASPVLALA
jgi:hypothetical protein